MEAFRQIDPDRSSCRRPPNISVTRGRLGRGAVSAGGVIATVGVLQTQHIGRHRGRHEAASDRCARRLVFGKIPDSLEPSATGPIADSILYVILRNGSNSFSKHTIIGIGVKVIHITTSCYSQEGTLLQVKHVSLHVLQSLHISQLP